MTALGIDRSVIVAPKPPAYRFEPENRLLAALAAAEPGRLTAFCRVDPWQRDAAVAEAAHCLGELGMAGLFLHPWEEQFPANHPLVDAVVAVAAEAGRPVTIAGGHVRFGLADQLADLIRRWPGVPFLVTSGGQINVSGVALGDARRLFLECPNAYLETSGIYRLDFIEDMAAELGAGRIVFGSDSPRYDQELELRRVQWAHRPDVERALMAGGNTARLLRLPGQLEQPEGRH